MKKFIPNSFQVPNALVDDVLGNLSDAALRVYIIIIRKTRGWQKESDRISLTQFQAIGKRSRHTVITGLSELESLGLVTKTDTEKGSIWALIDDQASANNAPVEASAKSALVQNLHQPSAKSAPAASAKSAHTKDTLTKDTIKKESTRTRKVQTSIPADFKISESVAAWASEKGFAHLQQHLESFIDKAKSKNYRYADWDAAFRDAIRKNWAGIGQNNQSQYSRQDTAPSTRQVESPAPEPSQRVSLFSGIELITFNELKTLQPAITQLQAHDLAKQHGMDVFVLMDRMIKKLKAGEAA